MRYVYCYLRSRIFAYPILSETDTEWMVQRGANRTSRFRKTTSKYHTDLSQLMEQAKRLLSKKMRHLGAIKKNVDQELLDCRQAFDGIEENIPNVRDLLLRAKVINEIRG